MLSMTRKQAIVAPAPTRARPDHRRRSPTNHARDGAALGQHVRAFDSPVQGGETRRGHSRRMARRTRLHGYALARGRALRVRHRARRRQHRPRQGQLAVRKLTRLARLARARRRDPRLAARARDQRSTPPPHPRAAPSTPAPKLTRPLAARRPAALDHNP